MKREILLFAIGGFFLVCGNEYTAAQYSPYSPPTYTDYYTKQLRDYHRPPINIRSYTIDKYFYHRPTLSPYLNLGRKSGADSLNNYYRYVRPEVQRRAQASTPSRQAPLKSYNSNPYFDQIYKPLRRY